jgi:hypothetical protein
VGNRESNVGFQKANPFVPFVANFFVFDQAVTLAVFEDSAAGGASSGMTIQQTMYATIPGTGGKIAASSQTIRTSVTSISKYRATPPQTPAIFPFRMRLNGGRS